MKLKTLKTKSTITLEKTVSAHVAEELKALFLQAIKEGKPISVKADSITHIDTLCCQLLVSAAISCREEDVPFEITTPSEAMQNNLAALGLENILNEGCKTS